MPWKLVHDHPACRTGEWAVVNQQAEAEGRHSIEGCHATRAEALAQQRALYANEPSAGRQAIHEVEQMSIQRFVLPIQAKAVTDTDSGEITGYAAVYGNVDLQDDMFERGAFAKSAEDWSRATKSRLPLLDWHGDSIDRIIGSVKQLKSTVEGLWFRAGFTKDERGQRARQLARDGHLSGVSVGWLPVGQPRFKTVDGKAVQVIGEARVHEISLTPIPANPLAQLASVKSLETKAVSDKPWSDFTAADYSPEQWRRACLIDTGQGAPDSKDRYKLPVREPSGALNRNGVHAAAGGHGVGAVQGVSPEKKQAAARALVGLYRGQLGEDPPPGLLRLAGMQAASLDFATFADAMTKALSLPDLAAKAAADALVASYHPDIPDAESEEAGPADGPPTSDAAAPTGQPDAEPAGDTAAVQAEAEHQALRHRIDDATAYALRVIHLEPRDGALVGTPPLARAGALAPLEIAQAMGDLDRLEAELHATDARKGN
jgi:HK97 family phage prohead protease